MEWTLPGPALGPGCWTWVVDAGGPQCPEERQEKLSLADQHFEAKCESWRGSCATNKGSLLTCRWRADKWRLILRTGKNNRVAEQANTQLRRACYTRSGPIFIGKKRDTRLKWDLWVNALENLRFSHSWTLWASEVADSSLLKANTFTLIKDDAEASLRPTHTYTHAWVCTHKFTHTHTHILMCSPLLPCNLPREQLSLLGEGKTPQQGAAGLANIHWPEPVTDSVV